MYHRALHNVVGLLLPDHCSQGLVIAQAAMHRPTQPSMVRAGTRGAVLVCLMGGRGGRCAVGWMLPIRGQRGGPCVGAHADGHLDGLAQEVAAQACRQSVMGVYVLWRVPGTKEVGCWALRANTRLPPPYAPPARLCMQSA